MGLSSYYNRNTGEYINVTGAPIRIPCEGRVESKIRAVTCKDCGETFYWNTDRSPRPPDRCIPCDDKRHQTSDRKERCDSGEEPGQFARGRSYPGRSITQERICARPECRKSFTPRNVRAGNQQYCGPACVAAAYQETLVKWRQRRSEQRKQRRSRLSWTAQQCK